MKTTTSVRAVRLAPRSAPLSSLLDACLRIPACRACTLAWSATLCVPRRRVRCAVWIRVCRRFAPSWNRPATRRSFRVSCADALSADELIALADKIAAGPADEKGKADLLNKKVEAFNAKASNTRAVLCPFDSRCGLRLASACCCVLARG